MVIKRTFADIIPDSRPAAGKNWVPIPPVIPGRGFIDIPLLDRRDVLSLPVGRDDRGGSSGKSSRRVIPKVVVQGPITGPGLLREDIGFPEVQTKRRLPVVAARVPIPPPVMRSPVPTGAGLPTKSETDMGLDLGNLLNTGLDLYGRYQSIKTGVAAPARVAAAPAAVAAAPQTYWPEGYGVSAMAGPTLIANTPGGGIPFGEFIAEPPPEAIADGMKGWAYKKSCGEWRWIKSSRRRRRVLLTESDYNSLLRVETLKVNHNMTIAIAKALGR